MSLYQIPMNISFLLVCKTSTMYNANCDVPDTHFDYLSLFNGTQAEKVGNTKKKCENCTRAGNKNKYCAMKLNKIRRRIELCMREKIP
jgi:hypothetical protein